MSDQGTPTLVPLAPPPGVNPIDLVSPRQQALNAAKQDPNSRHHKLALIAQMVAHVGKEPAETLWSRMDAALAEIRQTVIDDPRFTPTWEDQDVYNREYGFPADRALSRIAYAEWLLKIARSHRVGFNVPLQAALPAGDTEGPAAAKKRSK